jgi:hypothetical protein
MPTPAIDLPITFSMNIPSTDVLNRFNSVSGMTLATSDLLMRRRQAGKRGKYQTISVNCIDSVTTQLRGIETHSGLGS